MLKDHTAIYYLFIQLVNAVHFSILKFRICDYKFTVENARYDYTLCHDRMCDVVEIMWVKVSINHSFVNNFNIKYSVTHPLY